jgi:hypothetical protein
MDWIAGSAPAGAWVGTLEPAKLKQFVRRLRRRMTVWGLGANVGLYTLPSTAPALPAPPSALVENTVRVYIANVALVEGLTWNLESSGLFFWQPAVFTKRTLTSYEREREAEFPFVKPFFLAVSERVCRDSALRANPSFSPLTHLFGDVPEPRFLDFAHASDTAKREIAKHVTPLMSSRSRRAFLSDSDRWNKAAAAGLAAMARPDDEFSHATFRTRWPSLFDEPQR